MRRHAQTSGSSRVATGLAFGFSCALMVATQIASAALPSTSTGGSSRSPWKLGAAEQDLFCDFDDEGSNVVIEALPANAEPNAPKSFRVSGEVVCVEVPQGTVNPTLGDGCELSGSPADCESEDRTPTVGLFNLRPVGNALAEKITEADAVTLVGGVATIRGPVSELLPDGFSYETSPINCTDDCDARRWSFDVTTAGPGDGFMYVLEAVDSPARAFCQLPYSDGGSTIPEVPPDPLGNEVRVCQVIYGIDVTGSDVMNPVGPDDDDYKANGITGRVLDFPAAKSTQSELGNLFLEACHNQAHVQAPVFTVEAEAHSSNNGGGTGLDTGIDVQQGDPLIVHTDPDDLWTSGDCPRYSTADGQITYLPRPEAGTAMAVDFSATESDASAACPPAADYIGLNWEDAAVGTPNHTDNRIEFGGTTDAFGTLYGAIDTGPQFQMFRLGAAFNGVAPANGRLHLLYFDSNSNDNAGDIDVTVIAGKPILCKFDGAPAQVESNIDAVDGKIFCEATPNPNLNVGSGGSFPVEVSCCRPDDAPLANMVQDSKELFVNNVPVDYKIQNYETVGTCTISGVGDAVVPPEGTRELIKFGIDRRDLIGVLGVSKNNCDDGDPLPEFKLSGDIATGDGKGEIRFIAPQVSGTKLTGCK